MNLIIGFVLISSPLMQISAEDTCTTPECIHAASEVLSNLDSSVDPCDDFYSFACGSYIKDSIITEGAPPVTQFMTIQRKIVEKLLLLVQEPIRTDEIQPLVLPKQMYKACMNTEAIHKRGIEPLREVLQKLGGWPVVEGDKWNENEWSWVDSVRRFKDMGYGVDYLLGISLKPINQSKAQIVILNPKFFPEDDDITRRTDILRKDIIFQSILLKIAVLLGAKEDQALQELEPAVKLLKDLITTTILVPEYFPEKNYMTIESFEASYPEIPLLALLNTIFNGIRPIDKKEEVQIAVSPLFLETLNKLLVTTPNRVIANYLLNRAVIATSSFLSDEIQNQVLSSLVEVKSSRGRWAVCIGIVIKTVSDPLSLLYIQKYFDEDTRKPVLDIINEIQAATINVIKELDWMKDETKTHAMEKAKAILTHFAYSEELLDSEKLIKKYKELQFNENFYLESVLNASRFKINEELRSLGQPTNYTVKFLVPAFEVNAGYFPAGNLIEFPAGILHRPFFSSKRPQYMNYGSLGFVIGHEIIHGFDTQGRNFNKDGFEIDWWDKATDENYSWKVMCIYEQYSNYTEPLTNLSLNAVKTVGEDIADNCGVKVAYLAYKNWVAKNPPEPRLPGVKYSPEQMFWISAANIWCASFTPEQMLKKLKTDEHTTERFRVIGSFSNSDDFARDFNCPVGSPMNPSKKCKI